MKKSKSAENVKDQGKTNIAPSDKSSSKKVKTPRTKKDKEEPGKVLVVEVVAGRDLVAMDSDGTSDPYVIVLCGNRKFKTKTILATLNPTWDIGSTPERFVFPSKTWTKAKSVTFKCMDWDKFSSDDRMGMLEIPITELTEGQPKDGWFELVPQKPGDSVSGQLHLKVRICDPQHKGPIGPRSTLWKAVKNAKLITVEEQLKKPDVNMAERDENNLSLVHLAVSNPTISEDSSAVLQALLKHNKCDITLADDDGNTALHAFCKSFRPPACAEPFELFMKKGADVNKQNKYGETPLHQAMFNPSVRVLLAQLLLQKGANPNIKNTNGDTALHYAVHIGRQDLVKLLIAYRADCDIPGKSGLRPFGLAKQQGFPNIADTIRDSLDIVRWLSKNQLEKYIPVFLEEEIYIYLLPDLNEQSLAQHVPDKRDREKLLALSKDFKMFSRKETFTRKKSLMEKRENLRKREESVRKSLKESVKANPVGNSTNPSISVSGDGRPVWEIDVDDLEFMQPLGQGTSGQVFKGLYKSGKPVAIKMLKPTNAKQELDEFIREFSIMINIQSPYMVHFYGATLKHKLCMVMELCERGSLYDVLQDDNVEIGWGLSFAMLEEIVKGIQELHNHDPPIMHRDLKTLNVLVTSDFHCRIADFGLSRFDTTSNIATLQKCRGTYAYIAPEGYDKVKYSVKADIYSIAIMMWEFVHRCITGNYMRPYSDIPNLVSEFTILIQAAKMNKRPVIPKTCPAPLAKLIAETWIKDPTQRPDANQLFTRLQAIRTDYDQNKGQWDALLAKPPKAQEAKPEGNDEEQSDD